MDKFLLGVAVGALAMLMMDPQQGRRRRALVRDKLVHAGHVGRDYIENKSRDLKNRAQGVVADIRSGAARVMPHDDTQPSQGISSPS
jgi:gas vesicle protein